MSIERWYQVNSSLGWVRERGGGEEAPTERIRRVGSDEWTLLCGVCDAPLVARDAGPCDACATARSLQ
jgi:hypothetical protein